jgi:hypothetical protein
MTQLEELPTGGEAAVGDMAGLDQPAVAGLIARAARLTRSEASALAGAVAWQWQPLALPIRGSFASARAEALGAARGAGRAAAAASAIEHAGHAALESPGGSALGHAWSWAENGLAAVLIGIVGAIVAASGDVLPLAIAFGILAVCGAGVLLVYDTARVARRRLEAAVEAAALAIVVADLVPSETSQILRGPWVVVIHD